MAFEKIITPEAVELYQRLLSGEHTTTNDDPHSPDLCGVPAFRLARNGLASVSDCGDSRLFPVEPSAAAATLIRNIAASISNEHTRPLALDEDFSQLRPFVRSDLFSDTEVLTGSNKISHLSFETFHLASTEILSFIVEHIEMPQNQRTAVLKPEEYPTARATYTTAAVKAFGEIIDTSIRTVSGHALLTGCPSR